MLYRDPPARVVLQWWRKPSLSELQLRRRSGRRLRPGAASRSDTHATTRKREAQISGCWQHSISHRAKCRSNTLYQAFPRSPGSCARSLQACLGSLTTQDNSNGGKRKAFFVQWWLVLQPVDQLTPWSAHAESSSKTPTYNFVTG